MRKLKKIFTSLIAITAISVVTVGCSAGTKESATKEDHTLVTLVLDKGGVNDGSFNQSAWKGAQLAEMQNENVEVRYLESNTDADYYQNIETAVDMGSDLIIGIGFNLSPAIEEAANNYPEQQFAIVDGSFEEIPSNVTPILFDEESAGYLAGLAAAKTVETDKFGFVGGLEVPAVVNYKNGFEKGIKKVNPEADLTVQYANSFTDAAKGKAIADQMTGDGIECIMTAGGGVNNGVYESCAENGAHAVAVDMEQSHMMPEVIITSAVKDVTKGVNDIINKAINNEIESGKEIMYNIDNNGVRYEETIFISDETKEYIKNNM